MQLYVSCAAGLQQVLKKELQILGYPATILKPTLLTFSGDEFAIAQTNLRLRTANKVYLNLNTPSILEGDRGSNSKGKGGFVTTFDELFALVQTIDWNKYIGKNNFAVKAISEKSQLHSTPTIQSISEKAIHKKLENSDSSLRGTKQSESQPIDILILLENNKAEILLNTSGESLHKRGYKIQTGEAPINESLAAGLILLSAWKFHEPFYDIFCGSGTIPIEAALIAKNIAPGLHRDFAFQQRKWLDELLLDKAKIQAQDKMMLTKHHVIIGTDSDPEMIRIATQNAMKAGVADYIHFEVKKLKDYLVTRDSLLGTVLSNPPYGQRMKPDHLKELYQDIAFLFDKNPKLTGGIITSYEGFAAMLSSFSSKGGGPQSGGGFKKTPLYNGGTPCQFYKKAAS